MRLFFILSVGRADKSCAVIYGALGVSRPLPRTPKASSVTAQPCHLPPEGKAEKTGEGFKTLAGF